jgi:hypothetical protein
VYTSTGGRLGTASTDSAGAFRIRLPGPGSYSVSAEKPGYVPTGRLPLRLERHDAVMEVELALDTVMVLDPLVVRARSSRVADPGGWLAPFHERRSFFEKLGGKFFTLDDIEWLPARTPEEALVSLVPNFWLQWEPGVGTYAVTKRFSQICRPTYYRNGAPVSGEVSLWVDFSEVVAIEVYRPGVYAPGGVDGPCGSVVLWTRPPGGR